MQVFDYFQWCPEEHRFENKDLVPVQVRVPVARLRRGIPTLDYFDQVLVPPGEVGLTFSIYCPRYDPGQVQPDVVDAVAPPPVDVSAVEWVGRLSAVVVGAAPQVP